MSKLAQKVLRRQLRQPRLWYAPSQHIWLRCNPSSSVSASTGTTWNVTWGMTEQGMDRLGDITKLACLVRPGEQVRQGQSLLHVHWEGYKWTEADELYHTVWESVEGRETIVSPISGRLINVVNDEETIVDEDVAWAEFECRDEDVMSVAATSWVDESSYLRWVETLQWSKFSDEAA